MPVDDCRQKTFQGAILVSNLRNPVVKSTFLCQLGFDIKGLPDYLKQLKQRVKDYVPVKSYEAADGQRIL